MTTLTPQEQTALSEVAAAVQAVPADLARLIQFESGWNPAAKNPVSSARGLIQFIDSTAQSLGYLNSADLVNRNPTRESQLRGPVRTYLLRYAPLDTRQALAMSVFYPAFMRVPAITPFPDRVQRVNPGIKNVRDYLYKVYADGGPVTVALVGVALISLIALKGVPPWRQRRLRVRR